MGIGGGLGEAHISLKLTMQQYEQNLRRAKSLTETEAQKMALALRRVEIAAGRLTVQQQRLALATRSMALREARAEQARNRSVQSVHRYRTGLLALSRQFLVLNAAIATFGAALGIRAFTQAADSWVQMHTKLKLVTGSAEAAGQKLEQLFQLAQRSRSDLGTTVDFFFKLSNASKELGISEQQVIAVTETLQQLFKVGGVDAVRAAQATFQLTQTFTKQRLAGDELKTVFESFPPLLNVIAEQMGTTSEALSNQKGGIAVRDMLLAILKGGKDIQSQFKEIPVTIGDAMTQIKNSLTKASGIGALTGGSFKEVVTQLNELNNMINTPEFREGLGYLASIFSTIFKWAVNSAAAIGIIINWLSILNKKMNDMSFDEMDEVFAKKTNISSFFDQVTADLVEHYKQLAIEANKFGEGVVGTVSTEIAAQAEDVTDVLDDLKKALTDLKGEAHIAGLEMFQFAGALDMIKVAFKGQKLGNIAPESMIEAMKALSDAGFDVTRAFSDWPASVQAAFQALAKEEEATRRVTAALEDQKEKLDALKEAHSEYQKSRTQDIDAAIAKGEEDHQAWLDKQEEQRQQILDTRDLFAREVASGFTDAITGAKSFDEAVQGIITSLAEAVLQALIFKAVTAGIGAPAAAGGGAGATGLFALFASVAAPAAAGAAGAGFSGTAAGGAAGSTQLVGGIPQFAHGGILRRMATGGFITKRPMITPMATGAALIGEAGPEAVLPLKRMAGGDLGVATDGGGSGGGNQINIDARQATPGTAAAAVREAVRLAPGAIVNAQARGLMGRPRAPW